MTHLVTDIVMEKGILRTVLLISIMLRLITNVVTANNFVGERLNHTSMKKQM